MKRRYLFILAMLSTAIACQSAAPITTENLTGCWSTDVVQTQVGATIETFCFDRSGTVTTMQYDNPDHVSNRGTFRLNGDVLTFSWPETGASADVKISLRGDRLTMTSDRGLVRTYKKRAAKTSYNSGTGF